MATMPADVTITLRAVDEATPVIRRAARALWWYRFGGWAIAAGLGLIGGLLFVVGFLLGLAA